MELDYTPDEVANLCRVHVSTVRRWIGHGKVRAIRLPGGSYRIPKTEFDRLREPVGAAANRYS